MFNTFFDKENLVLMMEAVGHDNVLKSDIMFFQTKNDDHHTGFETHANTRIMQK